MKNILEMIDKNKNKQPLTTSTPNRFMELGTCPRNRKKNGFVSTIWNYMHTIVLAIYSPFAIKQQKSLKYPTA